MRVLPMSRLGTVLVGLILGAGATVHASTTDDFFQALQSCEEQLVELPDLTPKDACPNLIQLLESSRWQQTYFDDHLPTREAVAELRRLTAALSETGSRPAGIESARLEVILDELSQNPNDDRETLWDRFEEWLADQFHGVSLSLPAELSWVAELLQLFVEIVGWLVVISLAAGVVLAIVLTLRGIWSEVPRKGREPEYRHATFADDEQPPPLTIDDLDEASVADKPRILLQLLLQVLTIRGLIARHRCLTHRELDAALVPELEDQETLRNVALSAERAAYSSWEPDSGYVDALIDEGRRFVESLDRGKRDGRQ